MVTDRASNDTYYNYTDLNRVESKVAEVAELLTEQGYYTSVTVKTDWNKTDKPTETQMKRYLDNVKRCVNNFCSIPDLQLPLTMKIDYIDANNIEKALVDIETLVDYMLRIMRYSGTFYAGNNNGLLRGYCL